MRKAACCGQEDFGYRQIGSIKVSDAQQWIIKLHKDGRCYSTITSVRGVVKPAFQMACNEDIIRRNPFDFKLVDVVPNNSKKRGAMTDDVYQLLHHLLHHLPENLCRFTEIYVGSGQRAKNGKDAKPVDITAFADL